jgi:plastocyanin
MAEHPPRTNIIIKGSIVMKFATRWFSAAGALSALAFVAAAVSPAHAAVPPLGLIGSHLPAQAKFGTIKGRLVWDGADAPERAVLAKKGQAPKDPQVCAQNAAIPADDLVVDPKTKGVQFAFVYLVKPSGQNPEAMKEIAAKTPKPVVDQLNCRFVPHNLAVTTDQTVVFKSSDPTSHNLRYAGFANGAFNQMMSANSQIEKKFAVEKRPIPVGCDIHPWMTGYVMVFDHPFFAVTGEDGSFEIQGVPAGAQKLVVWQEKVGYVTPGFAAGVPVTVEAGATVDLGTIKFDPKKMKK